jgi:hypothetical protein
VFDTGPAFGGATADDTAPSTFEPPSISASAAVAVAAAETMLLKLPL